MAAALLLVAFEPSAGNTGYAAPAKVLAVGVHAVIFAYESALIDRG
jgi:hypothetical protein